MERTIQQNKALHKYFELLAESLNAAEQIIKQTLKSETIRSIKVRPWYKGA